MHQIAVANLVLALGATLILLGILSSLLASRFGTPLLLVFLVVGMLAGVDGPGGIEFSNYRLTYLIGSCALAIILFDGGLRTRLAETREALAPSLALATVGVALTAVLIGVFSYLVLGFGLTEGLLLGSIVASTDAAAVFFLLKTGGLQLKPRIGSMLEIESGSNDPVAVFLTLVLVELAVAHSSPGLGTLTELAKQAVLGGAMGVAGGTLATVAINRLTLPGGLHPLFVIALTVSMFGATSYFDGSGFLAVYVAGLVVGNSGIRAYPTISKFLESATWLCQIVMFLMLGLLVTPSNLITYAPQGLTISLFLMIIGRPAAVWICLKPFGFTPPETNFVSWVGLRGAVSIFLATVPTLAGVPNAPMYFNVAFFVVLISLLVQGWTIAPAARFFGMALKRTAASTSRVEIDLPGQTDNEMVGYPVRPDSYAALRPASLPAWLKPILVVRDGVVKNAAEAGQIKSGDYAYFVSPQDRVNRLDRLFAPLSAEAVAAAKRTAFGEFAVSPDAPLSDLATFYEIQVPQKLAGLTVAEAFLARHGTRLHTGSRLTLANYAEVVARVVEDGQVLKASLRLEDVVDLSMRSPQLPRQTLVRRIYSRLQRRFSNTGKPADPTK
ncbi:K(+)/H(+) antiporter NhaP2 [Pleomorphomonas sp. T1.2MG-36]|uniref:potassium/proton antiporter n=1 Tax=Pleomorphomonas sp. T1.2MG-36 TaxID=3041167 RepID=UPI00247742AA|nr:potassium/proton antiporter [Pleomorphomonas sp. T1.2MG-36]CAI9400022.1 K(+)/H(+) antiporter NhaP2 [Pleomorphomonas sp. T1.2MG-36]